MEARANSWFVKERVLRRPRRRLFCFSYAGGGSRVFAGWQERLGNDIEVLAVETPGRGRRFAEAPISDLRELISALTHAVAPLLDRPFVFFGHSNGALVAYELARSIWKKYFMIPQALFISGRRAPHLPQDEPPLYRLPDEELVQALKRYNGTPKEVFANPDLLQVLLPVLRADFCLGETYRHELDYKLRVDAYLYGGKRDAIVPVRDLLAWGHVFDGRISYTEFKGDHFFIHQSRDRVVSSIAAQLGLRKQTRPA